MKTEWMVAVTAVIGLIAAVMNWLNSGRKGPPLPPAVTTAPVQVIQIPLVQIQHDNGARPHRPRQGR